MDYWKFDQTLWVSKLGNCTRIPLNNQTLEKKLDYLKNIFSMIVFIFNLLQRHFLTGPLGMQRLSQKQQL